MALTDVLGQLISTGGQLGTAALGGGNSSTNTAPKTANDKTAQTALVPGLSNQTLLFGGAALFGVLLIIIVFIGFKGK
jgi:hypothetical protein